MTSHIGGHDMTDLAIFYALGTLSQQEARSFEEHLDEGCDQCRAELDSCELTVQALALEAGEAEPPDRVRTRLLAEVNNRGESQTVATSSALGARHFASILAADGEWVELMDGVMLKNLFVDKSTGLATSLVRMAPGTALPVHRHLGVEQFLVIEGDCYVAGQKLGPGDYHRAEAGSIHETTYTVDGTMFLLIAPERYEVLDVR